jgi:glycopeptide antibiotics resistance protein
VKSLSKALFGVYLLILLWLVLFKLSFNPSSVLGFQIRSLNLVPFAHTARANLGETVSNVVVFVPFGVLLSVNLKRINVWGRLTFVVIFSVAVEIMQFVLAIGATDITDVITNTFGGFLGLTVYHFANKYVDTERLDRFIVVGGTGLLIVLVLFRGVLFHVRYQRAH